MTYDAQELAGGRPFFLYTFARGASTWRFTSAPDDYTDSESPPNTFTASSIEHSAIRTSSPEKQELMLTLPRTMSFADTLIAANDTEVSLTIHRLHYADLEKRIVWKGFVGSGKRVNSVVQFPCKYFSDTLRRGALHYRIERTCRHVLYGSGCGLTQGDFEQAAVVTAISGKTVTLQATPDTGSPADTSYFLGGIIRFGTVSQTIDSQSGTTLTLVAAFPDLATEVAANGNTAVALAPGCPLNIATCNARFDNALNFGGFHELPTTGAFDGKSIA